jgi:pyruvate/2-oxoglutarate/acetoin dehydrogenase E1 component
VSDRIIEYRQALIEAMDEEMARDDRVFTLGEDVGRYGGVMKVTRGLMEKYGEMRCVDTPISEEGFTGIGVGAALAGLRPVVEIMWIDFATLAMDAIVNQAAKMRYMFGGKARVPVVIRTHGGGGLSYAAQHSQSLESWFVNVPGLITIMPSTPYDAKGLLKSAIRDDNPIIFIEDKSLYNSKGPVPEGEFLIPIGKADVKRTGKDLTILATSRMVMYALNAAEKLAQESIEVEVVDPRTLKPLDIETIANSIKKTHRLLVVNEGCRYCGYAAELVTQAYETAFDYLDAPIVRLTTEDTPIPYSKPLEEAAIPNEEKIIIEVRRILSNE